MAETVQKRVEMNNLEGIKSSNNGKEESAMAMALSTPDVTLFDLLIHPILAGCNSFSPLTDPSADSFPHQTKASRISFGKPSLERSYTTPTSKKGQTILQFWTTVIHQPKTAFRSTSRSSEKSKHSKLLCHAFTKKSTTRSNQRYRLVYEKLRK